MNPASSHDFVSWLLAQSAALVVALVFLYLERRERKACQKRNDELSDACTALALSYSSKHVSLVEKHAIEQRRMAEEYSSAQVKDAERHSLLQESFMRNVLDSLERAASKRSGP